MNAISESQTNTLLLIAGVIIGTQESVIVPVDGNEAVLEYLWELCARSKNGNREGQC